MMAKESWGDRLLYAAWASVIIATVIGLLLSWSVGQDFYYKNISVFDLVLSVLPFVVVSLIELTKVPLVKKIYKSPGSVSRLFLSIALLLVTLITFETLLTGLEREYVNYTNVMAELKMPVRLQLDVAAMWVVALAFIVSTSGIFLAIVGMASKKNKE